MVTWSAPSNKMIDRAEVVVVDVIISPFPLKVMVFTPLAPIIGGIVICSLNGPDPVSTLNTTGADIPQVIISFTASVKVK